MNFNFKCGEKMQKAASYRTKQKELIEKYIKNCGGRHFTVDSICAELAKNSEAVGRTTVYRYVERLTADGKLRKYMREMGESACYQYIADKHCDEHFHLKCEKCGRLIHMECDEMQTLSEHIELHHKFKIDPLKTVFYGICERCSTK